MAQIQPSTTYEHLLYTTVRLDLELSSGDRSIGTGFLYDHMPQIGPKIPLLVTNKHVISGSQSVTLKFHQRDTAATRWAVAGYVELTFPLLESAWTVHPNPDIDLAAIKLGTFQQLATAQGKEIAAVALGERFIPADLTLFDAVEDVIMIGYPSGWWDSANNYPLVRRGITASHPGIDFDGKPYIAIDMACFAGSSGSPVLLPHSPVRAKSVAFFDDTRPFAFLGVLFSGPAHSAEGQISHPSYPPIPTATAIPMNLGFVIKAKEVAALACHLEQTNP